MDPIDTMFRPTPQELANMFRDVQLIEFALIDVGTVWSGLSQTPKEFFKLIIRLVLPFYKPKGWLTALNRMLWMFRKRTIACVLLRKITS
jgi:hypothetical protein